MSNADQSCDMRIEQLAQVMFVANVDDKRITLSMPSLSCTHSLFLFCVDLLMRGLLLTFEAAGASPVPVPVHEVSQEQFDVVSRKMLCAGICMTKISEGGIDMARASVNLGEVMSCPRHMDLNEYKLVVENRGVRHSICFNIVRNLGRAQSPCMRGLRFA
jgi:hypothetical protein